MAFKMKGSSLYGKLNLNIGGNANRPDGRAKSSVFQKETDPTEKPDVDKQQNIANPDGGTWASGKPKTYKTLQSDGTYKVVTNPSGEFSKTAEDLVDTHVTKKQDAKNREQSVQDLVTKVNKKSQKKQKRKDGRKKLVSKVKGIFNRKNRKRQQDYENLLDQE